MITVSRSVTESSLLGFSVTLQPPSSVFRYSKVPVVVSGGGLFRLQLSFR